MVVYNVSQQISAHTFKCSRQTLSCKLSPIVCSTVVPLRMKSISWIRQSSFFWHFFKTENCFRSSGLKFRGNLSHVHQRRWLLCSSNYSLMEMTSSVANIICIAQITFKLIYNTLPANDGWFPLLNLKLLAKLAELGFQGHTVWFV